MILGILKLFKMTEIVICSIYNYNKNIEGDNMGFLDKLFKANNGSSDDNTRLVHCIDKLDKQENIFVNVMNDLGTYIERVGNNETNLRKMAYAYARRIAAAGLCAQGTWGQDEYDYTFKLFQSFQQLTEHSVEFQEKAAEQAVELIQSYDARFNKKILMNLVAVMSKDASLAKSSGAFYDVDDLLRIFNS